MTLHLYSYSAYSKSAKNLCKNLKIKRIKQENSKYRGKKNNYIINWGANDLPAEVFKSTILNKLDDVARNTNKLTFFNHQEAAENKAELLKWTNDVKDVIEWLKEGKEVIGRTLLRSHSGKGIVEINENNLQEHLKCPLFTQYFKKKDEYRVHIFQGEVINVQRKALKYKKEGEEPNFRVRNREAGFIYQIHDINPPDCVIEQALLSFDNSNLDFGAVDVLYNERYKKAVVCEINTAPGLEGNTLDVYTKKFEAYK
jgi:glutathione synthase/RimK-type ligase-like ATP-grasp enzyme